eukprot:CAMPEP_0173381778 /NCGR_PEP_ID=MMETSP1356-20130122/4206_1 /TAXON_ID=77927 ORGANISM="Hemiselmis virescens, Strain PCC157" /NCGR_SAMPLE_ID=MMETSP1356 /ASSEMBLY_ACC=CAM_ASM_000847 /LENGTH=322 /DNA_ID=CAMNT_0014335787 /DNA_START=12 /DNA_END=980 /DNA_ORIENTATION=+
MTSLLYTLLPAFASKHTLSMGTKRLPPVDHYAETYMQNTEGLWLYTQCWKPKSSPKGVIFLVHGMGEYCNRYEHVAKMFNEKGYAVYSMDHQGHGRSEGDRLYVERFEDYCKDYFQYIELTLGSDASLGKLPRFLYGHSMGGLITIMMGMKSKEMGVKWTGLIVQAPPLYLDPKTAGPAMVKLAGFLSWAAPKLIIPWEKGPAAIFPISHDETVCSQYHGDPLVYHGGMRTRFAAEILNKMKFALDTAADFDLPYLCIHGGGDRCCPTEGSEDWHAKTSSKDKKRVVIPEAFHELHNETPKMREEWSKAVLEWLSQHNSAPA